MRKMREKTTPKYITSIRLDVDSVEYLKKLALEKDLYYQQLVRHILRDYVSAHKNSLEVI
jgi:uncharacterized protein (DUF4415 family)